MITMESIGPLFLYHTFYILSVYEMRQFFECRVWSRAFDISNKPWACSTNKKEFFFSRTCITWPSKERGDFVKQNQWFGWKIMQGIVTSRSFASFILKNGIGGFRMVFSQWFLLYILFGLHFGFFQNGTKIPWPLFCTLFSISLIKFP